MEVRPSLERAPNTILSAPTPVDSLPLNIILLDLVNTPADAQAVGRKELIKLLQKKSAGMRLAIFVLKDRWQLLEGFTDSDAELLAAIKKKDADLYLSAFLDPNGQLSSFAAFAGNKKWHGVKVQRFKIEYSVFGDHSSGSQGRAALAMRMWISSPPRMKPRAVRCPDKCRPCRKP